MKTLLNNSCSVEEKTKVLDEFLRQHQTYNQKLLAFHRMENALPSDNPEAVSVYEAALRETIKYRKRQHQEKTESSAAKLREIIPGTIVVIMNDDSEEEELASFIKMNRKRFIAEFSNGQAYYPRPLLCPCSPRQSSLSTLKRRKKAA